ncbi:hypothetical protein KCP71_15035 [Salmonella enterica subsp. enterica]|nr:hypothetical protein KCP71_15035 [Salmonella enterica subsp. enterica]
MLIWQQHADVATLMLLGGAVGKSRGALAVADRLPTRRPASGCRSPR